MHYKIFNLYLCFVNRTKNPENILFKNNLLNNINNLNIK